MLHGPSLSPNSACRGEGKTGSLTSHQIDFLIQYFICHLLGRKMGGRGTSEHGLVDWVMLGWWIDLMTLEVFSSLSNSVTLWLEGQSVFTNTDLSILLSHYLCFISSFLTYASADRPCIGAPVRSHTSCA